MNNENLENKKKRISIQDLIDDINKDAIFCITSSSVLFEPSYSGTVITKDKKLYTYNKYLFGAPVWLSKHNIPDEEICLVKKLTDEELKKVEDFVRIEVFEKQPESFLVRDDNSRAYGKVDGRNFNVANNHEFLSKARNLIDEIKNS